MRARYLVGNQLERKKATPGAEQKTRSVEAVGAYDEGHDGRGDAPRHHDTRQPHARADPIKDDVTRHFGDTVGKEEQARPETKLTLVQSDLLIHRQGGKANVRPIEVIQKITDNQHGQKSPRNFLDDQGFRSIVRHGWIVCITVTVHSTRQFDWVNRRTGRFWRR
jgi:hypothetical protein